jgi:hypothetical protein
MRRLVAVEASCRCFLLRCGLVSPAAARALVSAWSTKG